MEHESEKGRARGKRRMRRWMRRQKKEQKRREIELTISPSLFGHREISRPPVCNAVERYVINASCRCYRCRGRCAKVVRVTTGDVRSCCRNGILLSVSIGSPLSLSRRSHRMMLAVVDRATRLERERARERERDRVRDDAATTT